MVGIDFWRGNKIFEKRLAEYRLKRSVSMYSKILAMH